jgi:hypothetical protein
MTSFLDFLQIAILLIAAGSIITLVLTVIKLDKRLSKLEKPRYGFMGKPLLAFAVFSFGVLSLTSVSINNRIQQTGNDVSVSDGVKEVVYAKIQVEYDFENDSVILSGIPVVDGLEWAEDQSVVADLEWSVYEDGLLNKFEIKNVSNDFVQPIELKGVGKERDIKLTLIYNEYIYFALLKLN